MQHPLITSAAVLAAVAAFAAPSLVEAAPVGARMVEWVAATDRPVDVRREVLRLECVARPTDDAAAVRCAWSAPTSDAALGVRLIRSSKVDDPTRRVVFRTGDLGVTEFVDAPVRRGVRYRYAVQAVDGHVVGMSRPVTVGVRADEPSSVEALRLECAAEQPDTDERARVGCRWSLPTESSPRLLTLWRSVDGGARQRVESFTSPFGSSYRDVVPAGTTRVVYAVIGTDGAGEIVARSRAEHVALRPGSPSTTVVPVRDVVLATSVPVATVPPTPVTTTGSTQRGTTPSTRPVRQTVPTTTESPSEPTTGERVDADRNVTAARVVDRGVGRARARWRHGFVHAALPTSCARRARLCAAPPAVGRPRRRCRLRGVRERWRGLDQLGADVGDPLASIERAVESDAVLRALDSLPERYQTVVSLRYLSDLSVAETAAALGTSRGNVAVLLYRAINALRTTMEVAP